MAKVKQPAAKAPADTSRHAQTLRAGKYGDRADQLYVPGEGFYLSKHFAQEMEGDCEEQAEEHGKQRYDDKRYHRQFINEETIEAWHREIQASRKLHQATDEREAERAEYEARCHDGTDTRDQLKGGTIREHRNEFELDRSESTASLLTIQSTGTYLNDSAVRHHNFVHMQFTSPDGRRLLDVAMTFDQFAAFLVSNRATPCTMQSYWSVNDDCVLLEEVVHEPETIHQRMEQRIGDRLDEMHERLNAITDDLDQQIESGKPMSKTKLAEIRKALDVYKEHFGSNRDFTVQQAKEEVSSIVEQAASSIAWQHKLSPEELLASPHVTALMETLVKRKALPAPNGQG